MGYIKSNAKLFGLLLDTLTLVAAFCLQYYVCWSIRGRPPFPFGSSPSYEVVILISWLVPLLVFGDYPVRRLTDYRDDVKVILRVNTVAVLFVSLLSFALKMHSLSRLFVGMYLLTVVVGMSLNRLGVRWVLYELRRAGWDQKTRVIIGEGPMVMQYLDALERSPGQGIRVIGFVGSGRGEPPAGLPYFGDVGAIREILAAHPADGAVLALPLRHPELERVISACREQGMTVELIADGWLTLVERGMVVDGGGVPRLYIPGIPHSSVAVLCKRVTDVVVSAIGLLILSPLFGLIAIAIKLDDGGPVFFSQERVGLRGRIFRIHKFRSMVVDAEARKQELLAMNEMSGPVFKMRNDPRVTRVGRFLRKTSLDELPQLWNVLKGEMSLVGPRPPLPNEVVEYDHAYRKRLSVKPGLTCLWQVRGRNNIDFDEWMQLDMDYIDNWSYLNDWKIILQTIPAVIRRNGAS
ncbi:sugar transferase [Alicyclobacillus fructus]|uniref:sugar transferase n=1 Tax=Alicyclobacillus fructus TaxID=2816082 RepID=UPI001A90A32E|nr:sugar transferase [Alicyclobacillus fructus]